jgi:hypothetical protein
MSLRLVRCPFCAKRFNVTGISAGTRLRCGSCTAILTVPGATVRSSAPRRRSLALVAGPLSAVLLLGLGFAWMSGRDPDPEAPAAVRTIRGPLRAAPPAAAPAEEPARFETPFLDDPVGRAKNEILREFGAGFIFTEQVRPYLVAMERSERYIGKDLIQEYASRLEILREAFRREFVQPLGLPPVDAVLPVVILNSRESFDRYCVSREKKKMAAAIKGFYEYGRRRVIAYHDFMAPDELLLHEGAHQLVHHFTLMQTEGRRVPAAYWFQEGVGTYFESFRRRVDGEVVMDPGSHSLRLPALRQALQMEGRKDFIPLSMLVGMTVDEFWDWFERGMVADPAEVTRRAQIYYAESWAFVHFLRQSDPRLRMVFEQYCRRELSGAGSKAALEELLRDELGEDLPQIEDRFIRHIQGLR